MEKIINNPGLQHLAEKVFLNLDVEDLKICAQINKSCKQILQTPIFCLRKFENLSKKNKKDWIKDIQSLKNCDKGIAIISYLKWNFKKNIYLGLPCYSNSAVQDDFKKILWKNCRCRERISDKELEIVKIIVPLIDKPNAPNKKYGWTPIDSAAQNGHTEIVKFLAPLIDNPNAPNKNGWTPLHCAAYRGFTKIVKILASLASNPNPPDKDGNNPIFLARSHGHTEIVKILESFKTS